ncbi:hypothetical protein EDD21DRAFT_153125 [Dissophora ornata]|nr:hypothetical protein BGZ58_007041 [Dissophora ornata]KAI8599726.1 hypothetical protein EDD21DRAFT_153125 [Dissophora ornata]
MTKIIASLIPLALSAVLFSSSAVEAARGKVGQIASIQSSDNFCFFLPPGRGGIIADNEDRAVAFCTKPLSGAPGARTFPQGFIQSAHYDSGNEWVQVTGRIDNSAYGLSRSDGGGQFDVIAPKGAACANYEYFVNIIEPDKSIYCIRCCNNKSDCNTGKSTYGCQSVLGGDYS